MKTNNKADYKLALIVSHFKVKGGVAGIERHGSGHIHDTFRVKNAQPEYPDYILQRINNHIFTDIDALIGNITKVTAHLRKKLKTVQEANPDKEVLTLIPSKNNQGYFKDEEGSFWRMYYFLKDTRTYDIVNTTQQAYEGGKAFGRFQALLSDLEAESLHETIPNFHNVEDRIRLFKEAILHDPIGRLKEISTEIAFVLKRAESMGLICRWARKGELPLRITHNDTKFNNVLLNRNDKAQCVIDLDTVMPGYVAYDFGDAIRTIINKAAEDEKDLTKIALDFDLFKGFTQGFLEETCYFLSEAEVKSLSHGVIMMPFIMGLRFLTDYIEGDKYYQTHYPNHNIQRARAQFKLVEKLEEHYALLKSIILKISKSVAVK